MLASAAASDTATGARASGAMELTSLEWDTGVEARAKAAGVPSPDVEPENDPALVVEAAKEGAGIRSEPSSSLSLNLAETSVSDTDGAEASGSTSTPSEEEEADGRSALEPVHRAPDGSRESKFADP